MTVGRKQYQEDGRIKLKNQMEGGREIFATE